ncbi:MAG TPA: aldose epimerase family protein [Terriglobales bacterium]|nr:aldose epimerase family protein [Terriglobales bacterium]
MTVAKLATILGLSAVMIISAGCKPKVETKPAPTAPPLPTSSFGKTADGKDAVLYVLKNKNGMEAAITNFGAALVSLKAPDRQGKLADIVLGYDQASGYENGKAYFGGTIGRYGNRIGKGKFALNGTTYTLATNNGANHLHGGKRGFDKVLWEAKDASGAGGQALQLTYTSKDGEEGYPGNLNVQVTYTLTDNNELKIDYSATTDKDTVVNLTNHSYFNLTGDPKNDILSHELLVKASRFTPVDSGLIPTGELKPVKGTPFDFTTSTAIGARIKQTNEQLKLGKGYDHNFVLDRPEGAGLVKVAEVYEKTTGRVLEVQTTEPGIQFYSGNFLDGTEKGKGGQAYAHRTGFCLETQHFPDSPNKPEFPSTTLKPGQQYKTTTVYKFSAR